MANSADPDQTAPLGLHCLFRPIFPKMLEKYGTLNFVYCIRETEVHVTGVGSLMFSAKIVMVAYLLTTIKFLNFRTPENFAVIYLKFKQGGPTLEYFVKKMQMQ